MSIHEAFEFISNANVELEFDQFDQFDRRDPEVVEEALATNWERFEVSL